MSIAKSCITSCTSERKSQKRIGSSLSLWRGEQIWLRWMRWFLWSSKFSSKYRVLRGTCGRRSDELRTQVNDWPGTRTQPFLPVLSPAFRDIPRTPSSRFRNVRGREESRRVNCKNQSIKSLKTKQPGVTHFSIVIKVIFRSRKQLMLFLMNSTFAL